MTATDTHGLFLQDINYKDYPIAVGHSKELISRINPEGPNTSHPDPEIFTQQKLDWMMLALDGYLVSKDFVIAVTAFDGVAPQIGQPKFDAMVSKARALKLALVRLDKHPTGAAEEEDLKASVSVLHWSWHEKMQMLLESSEMGKKVQDSLHLCASQMFDQAAELQQELAKATLQQHDPDCDSSWKAGLDTNADLKTLFQTTQEEQNVCSVDGEAVELAVQNLTKASLAAKVSG